MPFSVSVDTVLEAAELARALETYLADHPGAALVEDGHLSFEMSRASYALSSEHGRCVLQVWSEERNLVRTVVSLSIRKETLHVGVRRFGRSEVQIMQFVPDRDTRTPSNRSTMRSRFVRSLKVLLAREWSDWKLVSMRSAMDLEHSFGPAYVRGMLTRGQSAWALIAVSNTEMPTTVDAILTFGILWLHYCREQHAGRRVVQGLRVIVPTGMAEVTASRMAWLNAALAKWELWELEPQGDALVRVDTARRGNLKVTLTRAFDPASTIERYREGIERVLSLVPMAGRAKVEVRARSATEASLSLHGLEFARVRHGHVPGSFERRDSITFGAGANEAEFNEASEPLLRDMVERLFASRNAEAPSRDALYRLQPERWLESALRQDLGEIEPALSMKPVYSQVPAFAAKDRGMLDLLTTHRSGRLAVLELKADDDLQLPLQGLDYWLRVQQLHAPATGGSELERRGYFPGLQLSAAPPLLYFVAPALRIHPSNEIVLHFLAEEIEWTLIAINEEWRSERRVVFRKHSGARAVASLSA